MRPIAPHLFSMRWQHGLFAHWPFAPDRIRPHVPAPLTLDTYEDRAWVSVLPFVLADAGLRYAPAATRVTFPEVNLRTYVTYRDEPGLYFFSLDIDLPVAAGLVNLTTRLPCYRADMEVATEGERVHFTSSRRRSTDGHRAVLDVEYAPDGPVFTADPGSLDHWLAERRRFYDPAGDGVLAGDISHDPWPLQPAMVTITQNTLFEAAGLPAPDPATDPRVRYSSAVPITGSALRRLSRASRSVSIPITDRRSETS